MRNHNEEEQREEGDVEVEKTVQPQRKKRGIGKKVKKTLYNGL